MRELLRIMSIILQSTEVNLTIADDDIFARWTARSNSALTHSFVHALNAKCASSINM